LYKYCINVPIHVYGAAVGEILIFLIIQTGTPPDPDGIALWVTMKISEKILKYTE
jgi:hypothetical protein